MAITTLDDAIAGMGRPIDIVKAVSGTLVAGRAMSLMPIGGYPAVSTLGSDSGNRPKTWTIVSNTLANPTVVTVTGHPWSNGDTISIINSNSTPTIDGVYVITKTGANTFTVPVDVTVAGTQGVAAGMTSNGGDGLAGYALTSYTNQIPFTNPVSGNTYLARLQARSSAANNGMLLLCDRLWHNGGIAPTLTTAQTFTGSAQIPARDATGTNTGYGVFAALEVYSALGASSFTPTITYTNTAGTGSRVGTSLRAAPNSSIAGSFYIFDLQAGDVGVQKVDSITLGATATSGQMGVVLFRVIARLEIGVRNALPLTNAIDALTGCMPRIYNNTCPFLVFVPQTTTTTNIIAHIIYTQG